MEGKEKVTNGAAMILAGIGDSQIIGIPRLFGLSSRLQQLCRKEELPYHSSQHHKKQEMTIRSMAAVQIKTDKDKLNLTTGTLIPIGFSSLFSESLFTGAYERFSMYVSVVIIIDSDAFRVSS